MDGDGGKHGEERRGNHVEMDSNAVETMGVDGIGGAGPVLMTMMGDGGNLGGNKQLRLIKQIERKGQGTYRTDGKGGKEKGR